MTDKCPKCGTSPCYISFLGNAECSNRACSNYSKELFPPPAPPPQKEEEKKKDPARTITVYSGSTVTYYPNLVYNPYPIPAPSPAPTTGSKAQAVNKDAEEDPEQLNFLWSNYHNDFGDV